MKETKKSRLAVRILCWILAGLMLCGAGSSIVFAFARLM